MQDETIKTEIGEDMYSVPATVIEVDAETGEVIEAAGTVVEENS